MKLKDLLQKHANKIKNSDLTKKMNSSQKSHLVSETKNEEIKSFELSAEELLTREGVIVKYINNLNHAHMAIEDLLKGNFPLGLDIETAKLRKYEKYQKAGLDPHLSRIRLVQICNDKTVYIFDMNFINLDLLIPLSNCPMVAHNSVFEMKHLLHAGPKFININCTMLMANALDGNLPNLADLARTRLGWKISKELQTSNWSTEDLSQGQLAYAALDAVATFQLYRILHEELHKRNVFNVYALMLRATRAIAKMELNGIYFNRDAHKNLITDWEREKQAAEADLKQLLGQDLNPASGPQLSAWLKENLEEDTLRKWPRTKTGQLKTGTGILTEFSDHPLVKPLQKYKEVSKLLSTYGTKYASHVNPETGRIHANFRLGGTISGRLSCNSPNIQNPPRNKDFRALFCAPTENYLGGRLQPD